MATPKVFTDGELSNTFSEAYLNKYLAVGDADKPTSKLWYARIKYNGASWEVAGATDAAGLGALALSWNAGSSQLEVTLSGFTVAPVVLASAVASDTAYTPRAHGASATQAVVAFYDAAGVRQTTEATAMDCCLLLVGA